VGDPGAGTGEKLDARRVQLDAVGVPHVRPHPAQGFGVFRRAHVKALSAVGHVLVVFRQVGVEPHPLGPGQFGGEAHQIPAHGKGGAGSQCYPGHGVGGRVVEGLDEAQAIFQDGGLILHQSVRGQSALALAHAHAAPAGVETHTDFPGGENGILQAAAVGVEIEVVRGGGAAGEHELGHGGEGGHPEHVRGEPGPHRVKVLQPVEQLRILGPGQGPGQALVHVVMGVH